MNEMKRCFLKISQHDNQLEIKGPPQLSIQRMIGRILLIFALFCVCFAVCVMVAGYYNGNLIKTLPFLLLFTSIATLIAIVGFRMMFDMILITIDSNNIHYEKNGYLRRRKECYPRSEFLCLDKNFTRTSNFLYQFRPTIEIHLEKTVFELVCSDEEEQSATESLLRSFLNFEKRDETQRLHGFHVQIRKEDQCLVIDQPPQRKNSVEFLGHVSILAYFAAMPLILLFGLWMDNEAHWSLSFQEIVVSPISIIFLLYVYLLVCFFSTYYGKWVYEFSNGMIAITFECLGLQRRWNYYSADIQSIDRKDRRWGRRHKRIDRFVEIQLARKKFLIKVYSQEEQEYLKQTICTFIHKSTFT